MSRTSVIATLTDFDLLMGIRAGTTPALPPSLVLGGDLTVFISATAEQLALADAVLSAVTEWHAEINRRGHAGPVEQAPAVER